ncbi:hypothetical protein MHBO_003832 [Bonamia ostreae]|uniref:Uncharacterized protein n=1 Tax=Bonamia ostreae TaxID=126728 RepID=A0ABV2ARN4_9EUKA
MPSGKKCFDDEKLENNPEEKAKFEKRCEKFQLKREHTKFKDILSKATLKDLFRQLPSSLKRGSSDLENIVADLSHEEITASNKSYVIQDFRDNSISIDRARHAIDVAEHEEEDRVFRLVHDKINDRQSYKKIKDFKKRLELDESDRYYDNTPFCRTREDVRTENQRIHDEVESLKDEFSRPKMVTRSEKLKNEFFKDNYLCEPKKSVYLDAAGLSFLYWFCANCKVHFQKEKLSCPICRVFLFLLFRKILFFAKLQIFLN